MSEKYFKALFVLPFLISSISAHAFFHTGYVNGVSQGHLFGVRAPSSNSPIQDVTSDSIICNSNLHQPVSTDVIDIKAGDTFGMQWNHNLAGPTSGDADDPIAASHKGPVMVYMARVDEGTAGSHSGKDLDWFKVAEEGFDTTTRTWGVDTLIANKGLWSFTVPPLVPGEYLLRGEVLALHSAGTTGEAQFYMSCAGIRVTGSGTCSPSDTVQFPGAYQASDPGILISIYSGTGKPDNGGKEYTIPGSAVVECAAGTGPGTGSPNPSSRPISSSRGSPSTPSPVSPSSSPASTPRTSVSISALPTTQGNAASTSTSTSRSFITTKPTTTTAPITTIKTSTTTTTPSSISPKPTQNPSTFSTQTRTRTRTRFSTTTTTTTTTTSSDSTPAPTNGFHPWQGWQSWSGWTRTSRNVERSSSPAWRKYVPFETLEDEFDGAE